MSTRVNKQINKFLRQHPYFLEFYKELIIEKTRKVPTAAVTYKKSTDRFYMMYNPEFFDALDGKTIGGVLKHEAFHLLWKHVSEDFMQTNEEFSKVWNVAWDLAINSYLEEELEGLTIGNLQEYMDIEVEEEDLDEYFGCFPGHGKFEDFTPKKTSDEYFLKIINDEELKQQLKQKKIKIKVKVPGSGKGQCDNCDGTGKVPKNKDEQNSEQQGQQGEQEESEHENSQDKQEHECESGQDDGEQQETEECPECGGSGESQEEYEEIEVEVGEGFDGHGWENMDETERQSAKQKIEEIAQRAMKKANESGFGTTVTEDQRDLIREMSEKDISTRWRAILNSFVQNAFDIKRKRSIMKVNRRFPGQFPGNKRKKKCRVAVSMDQSGSVPIEIVTLFWNHVMEMSEYARVDVIPFAGRLAEDSIRRIQEFDSIPHDRDITGATNFNEPVKYVEDNDYDAHIVLTDLGAPEPEPTIYTPTIWVAHEDYVEHHAQFEPDELILIDDEVDND